MLILPVRRGRHTDDTVKLSDKMREVVVSERLGYFAYRFSGILKCIDRGVHPCADQVVYRGNAVKVLVQTGKPRFAESDH